MGATFAAVFFFVVFFLAFEFFCVVFILSTSFSICSLVSGMVFLVVCISNVRMLFDISVIFHLIVDNFPSKTSLFFRSFMMPKEPAVGGQLCCKNQ